MDIKEVSIILSGQFQPSIFNPNFVSANIFDIKKGEELELGLDQSDLKVIYKFKGITLVTTDNIIELKIEDNFQEETLKLASLFAGKIITQFPYIPKLQLGINFRTDTLDGFKNKFDGFAGNEFETDQVSYKKKLEFCVLNLIFDNNYTLFNYHYIDRTLFNPDCIIKHLKETEEVWKGL